MILLLKRCQDLTDGTTRMVRMGGDGLHHTVTTRDVGVLKICAAKRDNLTQSVSSVARLRPFGKRQPAVATVPSRGSIYG